MAIINPQSITEQQILADLERWIESQPDDEGWDAAFAGANGRLMLELASGKGAFNSYQARAARRESNALTAKLRSSILAIAFTFGYPVNRRKAARLLVNVTNTRESGDPMGDTINLARTPILGMTGTPARPVSLLNTGIPSIGPGETVTLQCALGEWKSSGALQSANTGFDQISADPPANRDILDIDNEAVDLTNITDNVNVPLTRYLELINDEPASAQIKTHPTQLVFLFGTVGSDGGDFGVRARGRRYRAEYLLLPSQLGSDSDVFGTFTPNQGGPWRGMRVNSVVILERELPADDVRKVARVLPGYFAAKRRMVTPSDHQAIVLSYGGMLDAALESGVCVTSTGEPLAEESIYTESACSTAGGVWKTNSISTGCVNVISYIRASTETPGEPLRYTETDEANDEIPVNSQVGWPKRLDGNAETALERYLRDFQMTNAELIFRTGIPVRVKINLVYRTTGDAGLTAAQLSDFTDHVHAAVKDQCFELGGTFDISRLHKDIESHDLIDTIILQTPRNNRTLSWLGFFDYDEDETEISDYTEATVAEQGIDKVTIGGYELPVRAEKANVTFFAKGKAEIARLVFDASSSHAIPNRDEDYADQLQLGYDVARS